MEEVVANDVHPFGKLTATMDPYESLLYEDVSQSSFIPLLNRMISEMVSGFRL